MLQCGAHIIGMVIDKRAVLWSQLGENIKLHPKSRTPVYIHPLITISIEPQGTITLSRFVLNGYVGCTKWLCWMHEMVMLDAPFFSSTPL